MAGYLAAVVESGRDPAEAIASYPERLAAVTPRRAMEVVRARLDPERLVAVVVADEALRGAFEAPLKAA